MKYKHIYIVLIRPTDYDGWGRGDWEILNSQAWTDLDKATVALNDELAFRRNRGGSFHWNGYVKDLIVPE